MWYMAMSIMEHDEDAQQNGMVYVRTCLGVSTFEHLHLDYIMKSSFMVRSLPIQARGFHFLYDDDNMRPVLAAIQLFLGKRTRARFRTHHGKPKTPNYYL